MSNHTTIYDLKILQQQMENDGITSPPPILRSRGFLINHDIIDLDTFKTELTTNVSFIDTIFQSLYSPLLDKLENTLGMIHHYNLL